MTKLEIVEFLRCPVTHSALEHADQATVDQINSGIKDGSIFDQVGNAVSDPIEAGLVNKDRSLLLPIRGEIAVLVADQAISLANH